MASRRRQRTGILRNLQAALVAVFGIMFIATKRRRPRPTKSSTTSPAGPAGPPKSADHGRARPLRNYLRRRQRGQRPSL